MAAHYGVAALPTRVRKPKDKALVENAVLQVERWVLAPLRHQRFFSLAELNQAIRQRLAWLNDRPMAESGHSRRERFEQMERNALQPLPAQDFIYREVKTVRMHIDYHVTFHKHHYSVPHRYARQKVLLRSSAHTVDVYDPEENRRIACHTRCDEPSYYSTEKAHMPPNHRNYLEWSPGRFTRWAQQIGPQTAALIALVLQSAPTPNRPTVPAWVFSTSPAAEKMPTWKPPVLWPCKPKPTVTAPSSASSTPCPRRSQPPKTPTKISAGNLTTHEEVFPCSPVKPF
ncbi:MAG TPA: hypothetical protein ENJ02_01035 [Chloroflexi bacterium]|nr:hypothetical protein [Chloroflexota bacterium]